MAAMKASRNPKTTLSSIVVAVCWWIASFSTFSDVVALYEEDAGQLDFVITTTGHGPIEWAQFVQPPDDKKYPMDPLEGLVLTAAPSSSCYVAARKLKDGTLVWRRNVCESAEAQSFSSDDGGGSGAAVLTIVVSSMASSTSSSPLVHTLETATGRLRTWDAITGSLMWETVVALNPKGNNNGGSILWIHSVEEKEAKTTTEYLATINEAWNAQTGESIPFPVKSAHSSRPKSNKNHASDKTSIPPLPPSVTCPEANQLKIDVAFEPGDPDEATPSYAWKDGPEHLVIQYADEDDPITVLSLLHCSEHLVLVLVSTQRGTTNRVKLSFPPPTATVRDLAIEEHFFAHEGLSHLSKVLLLDRSHYVGDVDQEKSQQMLHFTSRLQSQWNQLTNMIPSILNINNSNDSTESRYRLFGFVKTAVLLSPISNRIYFMLIAGSKQGPIFESIALPWGGWTHHMLYGTPNLHPHTSAASTSTAASSSSGNTMHHRDVLVVSVRDRDIQWVCFDGTTGVVHDKGQLAAPLKSPIVQIIPMAGVVPCRQGAMLLLQDGSTVVLPTSDVMMQAVETQLNLPPSGFYAHSITSGATSGSDIAGLATYHLSATATTHSIQTQSIGSTLFPGERVVRVAYPRRDEAIESPCHALGDDSLLLKYLNPHVVVMITMKVPEKDASGGTPSWAEVLQKSKTNEVVSTPKRKPTGATSPSDSTSSSSTSGTSEANHKDEPNLFVNLLDSVSGRVLYRVSHSNALSYPTPTAIISENWIFYSYSNAKTRRAEIGVLSLYEGMIDSSGLNAFTSPELPSTFSSFDARESKPVVLAKTYSVARPVTALGVTATRNGISGRRLVVSSVDGRVYTIDRKILEPRRPVGPLKDSEKKEGLNQYSEFIPFIPYFTLSYNLTIDGVQHILTAPTDLESQTLILAYGGPDLFFARTSPSRGFDLLPDNFNRVMLSLVVLALLAITIVLRQRVAKRFQKQAWL